MLEKVGRGANGHLAGEAILAVMIDAAMDEEAGGHVFMLLVHARLCLRVEPLNG